MVPAVTAALVLNVSPDNAGVVRLGLVPNTSAPDPVSSVTAAARFALEGVPRNVRIPVPVVVVEGAPPAPPPIIRAFAARTPELASVLAALKYGSPPEVPPVSPVPPLATGNVPVTSLARSTLPAVKAEVPFPFKTPVRVVAPLPPRVTGSVLIVPPSIGRPVALVRVSELGVPKFGVVRVGDVARTLLPVPVFVTLATFLLASKANAVLAVNPERVAVPLADSVVNAPVVGVVAPTVPLMLMLAVPLAFVSTIALGVPKLGVIRVGDVASTLLPEPVFATLTTFLLASNANAVLAVKPESVAVLLAVNVVKSPVDALLAPMGVPSIVPPLMSTKSDI